MHRHVAGEPNRAPPCRRAAALTSLLGLLLGACNPSLVANRAPVAFAGYDGTAALGDEVILDGTGSYDADGNALDFSWSVTLPDLSREELGHGRVARYLPLRLGLHLFALQVSDGALRSAPDLLAVRVVPRPLPPPLVARAGAGVQVGERQVATVSAVDSSTADSAAVHYRWSLVDTPDSAAPSIDYLLQAAEARDATLQHLGGPVGAFALALQVSAGGRDSDLDFVTIGVGLWSAGAVIRAEAEDAVRVTAGADGTATVNVAARLFGATSQPLVEWWVMAAPAGQGCLAPGYRFDNLAGIIDTSDPARPTARLHFTTSCPGVWQLLVCPDGSADTCGDAGSPFTGLNITQPCCPRLALSASCCRGLADRLMVTVEEFAP